MFGVVDFSILYDEFIYFMIYVITNQRLQSNKGILSCWEV
jgi:hypothetical protein